MSAASTLDVFYAESRRRRRASEPCAPLVPRLLGPVPASLGSAAPLARAVIGLVAGPDFTLGSDQKGSRAILESRHINLDQRLLAGPGTLCERLERWVGVATHEAGHLCHTPLEEGILDPLFRWIQNLLEDERIEARLVDERPEFAHCLRAARRELLDVAAPDAIFLAAVFTLVRCEAPIPQALWSRYESRLRVVVDVLSPFPTTYDEIRAASLEIALQIPPDQHGEVPFPIHQSWILVDDDSLANDLIDGSTRPERDPEKLWPDRCSAYPRLDFAVAPDCRDGYEQIRAKVARRANLLADRLQLFSVPKRGPRQANGRIDRRLLHQVPVSPRIFRGIGTKPPSLCVAVLIDLSGSMLGRSAKIAQEVGILVAEAIRLHPSAQVEVFGHSADLDGSMNTRITRFPVDGDGRPLGLGSLPVNGNNRDSHALDAISQELQASPMHASQHRIALLIADGAPSAKGFRGKAAIDLTRESILSLERAWGPVLYIATDDEDRLRKMVPGPSLRFRSGDVVENLTRHLTVLIRRSTGGRR